MRRRRRSSTRSARQCLAAASAASTAKTSGTARCKPMVTGAITHALLASAAQLSPLNEAAANQATTCTGRSANSSSNRACTNTQNSTALPTDTATHGACHTRGTMSSNSGVALMTCTHKPRAMATPTRAAANWGRSRRITVASTSSNAISAPRMATSTSTRGQEPTAHRDSGFIRSTWQKPGRSAPRPRSTTTRFHR